ncbi:hypothetical protein BJ166DRAFT_7106 [Pestalotiopsis sp. NC0098]|nr:hypothetical protein BJ166DRAFT_7106 [Pestalotiopsis sp. NC0098]
MDIDFPVHLLSCLMRWRVGVLFIREFVAALALSVNIFNNKRSIALWFSGGFSFVAATSKHTTNPYLLSKARTYIVHEKANHTRYDNMACVAESVPLYYAGINRETQKVGGALMINIKDWAGFHNIQPNRDKSRFVLIPSMTSLRIHAFLRY